MASPATDACENREPDSVRDIPSLQNNFAWTFAGNMVYAICQWGMLSVLAKLGSATIVGEFTLGLAISAPIFMFTNLQLRAVQATDFEAECRFADYFSLRLMTTLAGLVSVCAILPLTTNSSQVRIVILMVSISKSLECMSDVTAGLLQREELLRRVSISLIFRGIGSAAAFSLLFALTHSVALAVLAMSTVWLLVLLLYDVPNVRSVIGKGERFFRFDAGEIRKLAVLGLPLGSVATLVSLNTNIPRYFLLHQLGLAEQGIYASLAYLVVAVSLVVLALTQSVTTRLARMFAAGERKQFVKLMLKLSMLGFMVVVVGVPFSFIAGKPLLTLLYRPEYGEHSGLLALLVATSGLTTVGSFLFCGITAARTFRAQVPAYLISLLVGVVGAWLMIPRWGLIGAGVALLLSALTLLVGGIMILRFALKTQFQCASLGAN